MSSWADQPETLPSNSAPMQRKKLVLKPRSASAEQNPSGGTRNSSTNLFGAAKPREEVLAKKGIDAKLVDLRIEKKVAPVRLTRDQEIQVEKLREELTEIEKDLREANEMELPEEKYRQAAEKKRKELTELLAKFTEMNEQPKDNTPDLGPRPDTSAHPKYERPSEKRKRLKKQVGRNRNYGDDYQNDAYSSFGGRQHYNNNY